MADLCESSEWPGIYTTLNNPAHLFFDPLAFSAGTRSPFLDSLDRDSHLPFRDCKVEVGLLN